LQMGEVVDNFLELWEMETQQGPGASVQDHNKNEMKKNKMFLAAILVLGAYLGIGAMVFCFEEGWAFHEGLYFIVATLTTVGYGDFHPSKDSTKAFAVFFIFVGIGMIGYALGIVGAFILERQEAMMKEFIKQAQETNHIPEEGPLWKAVAKPILQILFLLFLGTLVHHLIEGNDFITSIYWSTVTCSSVGYGDVPLSEGSQYFAIFYMLTGTIVTASSLGELADVFIERGKREKHRKILREKLTTTSITDFDGDGDGQVSEQEFLEAMLVKLGKVTKADINEIKDQFKKLDVDGSGFLDEKDLVGVL